MNYTFLWGDFQTLNTMEVNIDAFRECRDNPWNERSNIIQVSRKNIFSTYHSDVDLAKDHELGKKYLEREFSDMIVAGINRRYKEHWDFYKKLSQTNVTKLTDRQLFSLFEEVFRHWKETIGYFRATQAEGTEVLLATIKDVYTTKELAILLTTPEPDIAAQERADWGRIDGSDDSLWNHVHKYPWTVMSHFTKEDVMETLRRRFEFDKKTEENINREVLKEKQAKLIAKHPELEHFVRLLQRLAMSRMEIKSCWAGTDFYLLPIIAEISKRSGEKAHDLGKYYFIDETRTLLLKKEKLSSKEKQRRDVCVVGLWKEGKSIYVTGTEAEQLAEQELGVMELLDELKGTCANPGKEKGIARILIANDVEQNNEVRKIFKQGNILVTQMTQPNVMDIASKAGAFVTDEGGMLSHAAIISRELGVPCVVGTHSATKTIKDGDLIEVDAEKGIVTKIK